MGGTYCCPYGPMVILPTFWIAAAVTCTYYAGFECTFFQVHNLFHREVTVTYGLWTVEDYENSRIGSQEVYLGNLHIGRANSCSTWEKHAELDNEDVDGALQFARVSHLLACIAGSSSLFWIVLGWWIRYWTCTVYVFVAIMVLAAVFMACSFSALRSDYCDGHECELDFAGYIGIVATIFWLFAACSALLLRSDRQKKRKNDDDDEESVSEKRKKRKWRRRRKEKNETTEDQEADGVVPGADQEAVPLNDDSERYRDDDGERFNDEPAESYLGGNYDDQYGGGVDGGGVDGNGNRGYDEQQQQYNDGTYVIDDDYNDNNDGVNNRDGGYYDDGYGDGDQYAGEDEQQQCEEEGNARPQGSQEPVDSVQMGHQDYTTSAQQHEDVNAPGGDTQSSTVDEEIQGEAKDSVPAERTGEFT